jgi:hypothetical protein
MNSAAYVFQGETFIATNDSVRANVASCSSTHSEPACRLTNALLGVRINSPGNVRTHSCILYATARGQDTARYRAHAK